MRENDSPTSPVVEVSQAPEVSRETVVEDFRKRMEGKLSEAQIDAAAEAMNAATTKYFAMFVPISLIFYVRVEVLIQDPAKLSTAPVFGGDAGGIMPILPIGGFAGDVYTEDVNRLFTKTRVFETQILVVYSSVVFFDENWNLLGHYQGGGASTNLGVAAGTGTWDKY
jgi:Rhodococcus equi virulence-associated protein